MTGRLDQNGYILLPVIFAIALVATIAFMINTESSINIKAVESRLDAAKAEYLAQAGLQHALWNAGEQGCGPYTDLSGQPFGGQTYTTVLTTGQGSTTDYAVSVDQDAWIRNDGVTNNNASDPKLHVRFEAGVSERALLRYDLSTVPANSRILSATAWFYVNQEHPEGPVDIHRITSDWLEIDATWESMGDKIAAARLATIPTQPTAGVWVAVNLTHQVQAWVNGQSNFGITLNSTSEGSSAEYASREATQKPYMEVIVGPPPSVTPSLSATGTLSNGISREVTRNAVRLYQTPGDTLEIQPDGAAGVDAYIWLQLKNANYQDRDETWVATGTNNTALALFRFDLSGIPMGAKILSASLSVHRRDGNDSNVPVTAHRITRAWDETYVTWSERQPWVHWDTPGGDFDPVEESTTPVGPGSMTRYEWPISRLVAGWKDGTVPNYGVILRTVQPGIFGERFDTSDHADPARRPRLTITYTCECGSVCMTPQGAGKILMVVGNASLLTAGEMRKKALFEGWGYTVNLITQWDVDWNFGVKAADMDVVYVSEAVISTAWGMADKLAATSLGVVNEEGELNDELGMASGSQWPVGKNIHISDSSHYITQPFADGALPVFRLPMEGLTVSGTAAPGLQILAEQGGSATLAVLDNGAGLLGGGSAPGRRVMLPIGRDDGDFNWEYVDSNGLLLVQRAIEWAMQADDTPPEVCGDFTPIRQASEFSTAGYGSLTIEGLTYLREGLVFKGVSAPVGGAWLIVDSDSDKVFMTDMTGNHLDDISTPSPEPTGMAYIAGGSNANRLVFSDSSAGLLLLDMDGNGVGNLTGSGEDRIVNPVGVTYIGKTASGTYDGTLAVLEDTGRVKVIDQTGALMNQLELAGSFTQAEDIAHIAGTDSLLIVDRGEGLVLKAGLDTGVETLYDVSAYASTASHALAINADTCEHAFGDIAGEKVFTLTDVPREPIAHWKMDDGVGTIAVDEVGGHHASLINGPTWDTGELGEAISFDGANDYASVPHDDTLSLTGAMTFTAWVNAASYGGGYQTILAKEAGGSGSNFWFGTRQQRLVFGFIAGGSFREVETTGLLQVGAWQHLAASFDDATQRVRLYVDGVEVQSGTLAFSPSTVTADLTIGSSPDGEYWPGLLDDVRIYDGVMGGNEIAALVGEVSGGGPDPDPDPIDPGEGCSGTYADSFNQQTFSGSDGTLDWTDSPWIEVGESDGATKGDIRIVADSGNYQVRLQDNDNGGEGIQRTVNLAAATTATLSYRYRRATLDSEADFARVEISATGAPPWTQLAEYAGPDNDTAYQGAVHDITLHASASTAIRFISSPDLGPSDRIWFEDVQIECTAAPPPS